MRGIAEEQLRDRDFERKLAIGGVEKAKFPVFFPVGGEFRAETGSPKSVSTTNTRAESVSLTLIKPPEVQVAFHFLHRNMLVRSAVDQNQARSNEFWQRAFAVLAEMVMCRH